MLYFVLCFVTVIFIGTKKNVYLVTFLISNGLNYDFTYTKLQTHNTQAKKSIEFSVFYNKTKHMYYFLKFIFGIKLYMFRIVPLSIIRSFSLYTQQWYMSYRFADRLRAGSGRSSVLILLATSQQTCMTYTIAVCTGKN